MSKVEHQVGRSVSDVRRLDSGRGTIVPGAEIRSYYGHPVIKPPVWKPEIPWYFFAGGLAGASSVMAAAARASGRAGLARAARRSALAGALASPALLVADLGRPERFHHMLRVLRPTSPMNMGAWLLSAYGPAAGAAAVLAEAGVLPRFQRVAETVAAALGPGLATYTAVLVSDTSVPVWHEARRELPFLFAAGALASAGAAGAALAPANQAAPARRLALLGAVGEQAATMAMERRLGELGRPYHEGRAGRYSRAAKALTLAGGALLAVAGRRRRPAVAGSALMLAGAVCERWAVFRAGFQSAQDPEATVKPQRQRLRTGAGFRQPEEASAGRPGEA